MDKIRGNVGAKARGIARIAKRNAERAELKAETDRVLRALGEAHYRGKPGLQGYKEALDAMYARMAELNREIDSLRGERRCERCDAAQSAANRFCARCGAALEVREAEINWPGTQADEEE